MKNKHCTSYGKVYLVGTGPGDVELITRKGHRLICQADVILHDHLIPAELLNLARPDAEIISVGKFASRHTMPQEKINELLIEKAKTNNYLQKIVAIFHLSSFSVTISEDAIYTENLPVSVLSYLRGEHAL